MTNLNSFLIIIFACLTLPSGLHAQYRWQITHPDSLDGYTYIFSAVDCSGMVCTAAGMKVNDSTPEEIVGLQCALMFFRSTDEGRTWNEQDPGWTGTNSSRAYRMGKIEQIDSLNAIALGDSDALGANGVFAVVRTFDGGKSWHKQWDTICSNASGRAMDVNFSDPMTGIFTWYNQIFTTHDGGAHWALAPFVSSIYGAACHSDGGNKYRVVTQDYSNVDRVYSTSDNWQNVDSLPFISPLSDSLSYLLHANFKGADTVVAYGGQLDSNYSGIAPQLFPLFMSTSTDGGAHWARVDISDTMVWIVDGPDYMSSLDRGVVFWGGYSDSRRNIAVSMNHGLTWKIDTLIAGDSIYPPLFVFEIWGLTVAGDGGAIAIFQPYIGGSTYLARIEEANSEVKASESIVESMILYPNPATNSIHIESPSSQFSVVDPLARSFDLPRSGNMLDVTSLPPGVYYLTDGLSRAKFVKE